MTTAAQTTPLLEVDGLRVAYHQVAVALHGISMRVMPQTIVALVGNNGAGKTTTLRAVSGFISLDNARVTGGSIRFLGKSIENQAPHASAARGIVLVPEREKVFPNLTVDENLAVAVTKHVPAAERRRLEELAFELFPPLTELRTRTAGLLSGGQRQMLAFASALVCGPKLLLVDELSLGLAPVVVEDLARSVASMRKELGITVLLVEQNVSVALAIADYGYVLENGRVAIEGTAADLRGRPEVQDSYMGRVGGTESRGDHAPPQERPHG